MQDIFGACRKSEGLEFLPFATGVVKKASGAGRSDLPPWKNASDDHDSLSICTIGIR